MEVRHRGNRFNNIQQMETFQILQSPDDNKDEDIKNQKCLSAVPTVLLAFVMLIILNTFVFYMDNRLPGTIDTNSTYNFVAKRAMLTLNKLENIGQRPVGSYENEKLAFNLIKTEIENIKNDIGNINDIEMFNQKVSGSFSLNKDKYKYVLSYKDLQNIIVKIDPKKGVNEALLLNCHYDTVPAGPGISDNGVNCAVMIELLRILPKCSNLKRPIIFLFNGGEEIILQASHGFITQHPWSQNTKYLINLDSCGAGGREIMFQTTKKDSFLVDLYAHTVPHPHGQVIGEEIFQSGIIPSDTDFRIFRDFGNMSGVDLAHYKNGFVYHTKYDNLDQIKPSVLQNTGENLLEFAKAISSHNVTKNNNSTKYIFFDVLGIYMFSYTELFGAFTNFVIVLISFFSIFLSFGFTTTGMNRKEYGIHLLTSILNPVCSIFFSILFCILVAYILDFLGRSMSWYSNKINLIIYCSTALLTILSTTILCPKNSSRKDTEYTISILNSIQFFWTILLFLTTMMGLRSSYLFMIMVLFPSVTSCILGLLNVNRTPNLWIVIYSTSLLVPVTFILYLTQIFIDLFIPITGRFGSNINPDYIIGTLMAMSTFATIGNLSPIIFLVKKPFIILASLGGLVLLSGILILSPIGFPYSDSKIFPKNERFDLIHTQRTFYDFDQNIRFNDSGYLIVNWDRHSPHTISKYIPKMKEAINTDCSKELLCGLPLTGKLAYHSSWISVTSSVSPLNTKTTVILKNLSDHRRRMEFTIIGPERINLYISPYPGTSVRLWSFTDKPEVTMQWKGNDVYIIKHSRGGEENVWNFWLEQESNHGFNEKTINFTVASNWVIHKKLVLKKEFENFINSFPSWAHVNYGVASVDAFIY